MKLHTINIPVLDNDGSSNAAVIEAAIETMIETFGGATVFDARGCWKAEDGKVYDEAVKVIQSAGDQAGMTELQSMADDIMATTDQLAVFISSDGKAAIRGRGD